MTFVWIAVLVAVAVFIVFWAALVVGGRADAGEWTDDAQFWPGAEPPRPEPVAATIVVDAAALRARLEAVALLVRARRVELVVPGSHGGHVMAAAGPEDDRAQEAKVPAGSHALLVASRGQAAGPFRHEDLRLLAAIADTLDDVMTVVGEGNSSPSGRFDRPGLLVRRVSADPPDLRQRG